MDISIELKGRSYPVQPETATGIRIYFAESLWNVGVTLTVEEAATLAVKLTNEVRTVLVARAEQLIQAEGNSAIIAALLNPEP